MPPAPELTSSLVRNEVRAATLVDLGLNTLCCAQARTGWDQILASSREAAPSPADCLHGPDDFLRREGLPQEDASCHWSGRDGREAARVDHRELGIQLAA